MNSNPSSAKTAAPPLSPQAKALGFFLVGVIFTLIALGVALIAPPASLTDTNGQAHISFIADRRNVFRAGDCINLHWDVEGISAVYINTQPTVGSDNLNFCVTVEQPTAVLHVVFQDSSTRDYPLTFAIVSRSPVLWASITFAGLAFIGAAYILLSLLLSTRLKPLLSGLTRILRLAERAAVPFIIILIFLELEAHFYVANFGTETEKARYIYTRDEITAQPSLTLPMPYVSYVASPGYPGHNQLGYRGADIAIPKPPGTFRIVTLGGSTTYSSATSAEDSYPAQLQNFLRDQYGYTNVEVVNAGLVGYTSWDSLVNYMLRVTELQPDMLIIYDGINDVQPRAVPVDCYQGMNPLRGLNVLRGLYVPPQTTSFSALFRLLTVVPGSADDSAALTGRFNYRVWRCSGPIPDNSKIKDNPPIYFERNIRDIIVLAQSNHTQVMLSTWTYFPQADPGYVPPEWRPAIDENNAILRDLADQYHLPFYDLAATDFRDDASHWAGGDPIHMSAAGTHEQARLYAAYIDQARANSEAVKLRL